MLPIKKITGLTLVLCLLCFCPSAFADDMWSKFGRGVSNAVTGPYEIVYQTQRMAKHEPWPVAAVGGFGKGLVTGALRMVAGAYEVVTFPVPVPFGYKPVVKPEVIVPLPYPPEDEWPVWGNQTNNQQHYKP